MNEPIGAYEFGPYRLDARTRLLTRDGTAVALAPKPFDLLLLLVRSRGRILERDETVLDVLDGPFWYGFALSPDERSILFSQLDSHGSDLMLVENLR
jgi:DNA-binding response OmpR family regulator